MLNDYDSETKVEAVKEKTSSTELLKSKYFDQRPYSKHCYSGYIFYFAVIACTPWRVRKASHMSWLGAGMTTLTIYNLRY